MAITTAMRTEVSQLYVALFGRAPDGDGLGFWVQLRDQGQSLAQIANTMYNTTPARQFYPSFLTNTEVISAFYSNVLGRTADADGLAFWTGKLNAAGATPGSVIAEMINVVATYKGTDAAGKDSAALFNNRVTVAQYYGEKNGSIQGATDAIKSVTKDAATVTAANTAIDKGQIVGVNQGLTLTLTNQTDNLVGGAGNDTFIGDNVTASAGDTITGGSGFDLLKIYGTAIVPNISSVESVYYNAPAGDINLTTKAEVTNIEMDSEAGNRTITVTPTQSVALTNLTAAGGQVTTIAGNTNTSVNLALNNVVNAAAQQTVALTGTALTTVNITTTGAASSVALTNAGGALTTVNVAGDKNLRLDSALTTVTTINASTATGNVNVNAVGASNLAFTGGKGADRINIAATLTAADKLDGGEGDDTIAFSDADTLVTASTVNVKNFELLQVTTADGTAYNVDNIGLTANPLKGLIISESGGAGTTVTNINTASINNISFTGDTPTTIALSGKDFVSGGTTDTATITLDNSVNKNADGVDIATSLTFTQVDVLNVVSKSDGTPATGEQNSIAGLTATDLEKIVVTGDQSVSITTAAGTAGLTEVDASAATGALTLITTATANTSILVKDTTKADVITINNAATNLATVHLSGGNDAVTWDGAGGATDQMVVKVNATALGAGALAAGTTSTVTVSNAAAGATVALDLGAALNALLKVANTNLGTTGANVNVHGTALSASTNIAAAQAGNNMVIQIDVNGNGQYDATADAQITLVGTGTDDTLVFNATTKQLLFTIV